MNLLKLFSEEGFFINLRKGKDWVIPFPVLVFRIYFPIIIFKKYESNEWVDTEGSIFKISFPSEFYIGWDRECFRISVKVVGFGIEYYYQWSY